MQYVFQNQLSSTELKQKYSSSKRIRSVFNSFQQLTNFAKPSILDVLHGSEYAYENGILYFVTANIGWKIVTEVLILFQI